MNTDDDPRPSLPTDVNSLKHPTQPLYRDQHGTPRFKENKIVRFLLDGGPYDMNKLALMPWSDEDREQFAQLIGYSLVGFGELSYVSDETYEQAIGDYDVDAKGIHILRKAAKQFRHYETQHRGKIEGFQRDGKQDLIEDTTRKAEANAALASEIEAYLSEVNPEFPKNW